MEKDINQNADNLTTAFGISASVAIVFNTLLMVAKESNPAILAWMKMVTIHHWITHGLLVTGVFIILGLVLYKTKIQIQIMSLTWMVTLSSILSGLGIVIFFLLD
ncbi:MAG: hypothetical protein WCT07_01790 [Candidatus Paceibacterota bacterium]|jgi:hypothetical protein